MTRLTLGGRTSELDPKIESNLDAFNSRSAQKTLIDPEPGATRLPTEPLPSTRENAPCVSESARYKNDTRPSNAGNPEGSLLPTVPAFRKGLWMQKKFCHCRPLRNAGTVGRKNAAGLPNITGSFHAIRFQGNEDLGSSIWQGAIKTTIQYKNLEDLSQGAAYGTTLYYIDASKSSPVYGASQTVMIDSSDVLLALYVGHSA